MRLTVYEWHNAYDRSVRQVMAVVFFAGQDESTHGAGHVDGGTYSGDGFQVAYSRYPGKVRAAAHGQAVTTAKLSAPGTLADVVTLEFAPTGPFQLAVITVVPPLPGNGHHQPDVNECRCYHFHETKS